MSDAVTPDQGSVQLYRVITTPFILSSDKERHSRERRFSREGEGIRVDEASSNTTSSTTSKAVGTTVILSGTLHGSGEDKVKEARFRHRHGHRHRSGVGCGHHGSSNHHKDNEGSEANHFGCLRFLKLKVRGL